MSIIVSIATLVAVAVASDPIAVIGIDYLAPKMPLSLYRFPIVAGSNYAETLGPKDAKVSDFIDSKGTIKQLLNSCAADRNGDGTDEVALLVGPLNALPAPKRLVVLKGPDELPGSKPKVVASSKEGDPALDGLVFRIGRLDLEGDGVDELLIVRSIAETPGAWDIEVRSLPKGKNKKIGPALRRFEVAASNPNDLLSNAFGLPLDPVPGDELVLAFRGVGGSRLEIGSAAASGPVQSIAAPIPMNQESFEFDPARVGPDRVPGVLSRYGSALWTRVELRPITLSGAGAVLLDEPSPGLPKSGVVGVMSLRTKD